MCSWLLTSCNVGKFLITPNKPQTLVPLPVPCFFILAAFLPSSFCMYTTLVAMTGWYMDKTSVAVLGVAAGAILGWPFSAALG